VENLKLQLKSVEKSHQAERVRLIYFENQFYLSAIFKPNAKP